MKAITVCQPFASLIALPESDPRHKRTENRTWYHGYRGPILIHAGKSREWLSPGGWRGDVWDESFDESGFRIDDLPFGAAVATARVVDWCRAEDVADRHPHLADHVHVEGPWCIVLADVVPLAEPVPMRGDRGLFDVPFEPATVPATDERT